VRFARMSACRDFTGAQFASISSGWKLGRHRAEQFTNVARVLSEVAFAYPGLTSDVDASSSTGGFDGKPHVVDKLPPASGVLQVNLQRISSVVDGDYAPMSVVFCEFSRGRFNFVERRVDFHRPQSRVACMASCFRPIRR